MSRMFSTLITIVLLISITSGCRNCRWNPCNSYCGNLGSSTLPAPPTGTLQIPSLGQNQPYYSGVPTTAQQPSYLINPNSTAPTPALNSPTLAPQQGWRPVGNNGFSSNTGTVNPNQVQPRSVLQNGPSLAPQRAPTGFATQTVPVTQRPGGVTQPGTYQVASNSGLSYKDSVNYRSTRVDERLDDTRLPATDATGVRAPTTLGTNPAGTRVAQALPIYGTVVPFGQPAYSTQPTINQPLSSNRFTPTQFVQPANPGIVPGTVQYVQPSPNIYNGYPAQYTVPGVTNSGSQILAQSTTTYDPQNNLNNQSGWRDRELTARR